jgi:SAM-dependent methyltransferase
VRVGVLTPARRRGVEFLDDPAIDGDIATRSLRDVARSNRLFGGRRAVLQELEPLLRARLSTAPPTAPLVLLDVGTGLGDIPKAARGLATRCGVPLVTVGLELTPALARAARPASGLAVSGSALALPFASHSVDFVTCSQVLHHFADGEADALLLELNRVAKRGVIVSDLRRSWLAVALLWFVSFPLGFHPVSRHDGMVSILRGYTVAELSRTIRAAVGRVARVHRRLGWRITATWSPS